MSKKIKVIDNLSKKAKVNILIGFFLIFLVVVAFSSINLITDIVDKRQKITELEEKLSWTRNNNIKLLAEEKKLYDEDYIKLEAKKQFNITEEGETSYFVHIDESTTDELTDENNTKDVDISYQDAALWENIKLFYDHKLSKE